MKTQPGKARTLGVEYFGSQKGAVRVKLTEWLGVMVERVVVVGLGESCEYKGT